MSEVTIIGPNLPKRAADKGTLHVHRADRLSAAYLEGFADGYRAGEEAQAAKEAAMREGAARARQT